jgi:hypothetical protein
MNSHVKSPKKSPELQLNTLLLVFSLLFGTTLLPQTASAQEVNSSDIPVENRLLLFTSDGCSEFPNAVPGYKKISWLHCCINHDVQYWQGGEAQLRRRADETLRSCVSEVGGRALGDLVFAGVRVGGNANLPTSWNWGYGWTLPRGYTPLSPSELAQVERLKTQIPRELTDVALAKTIVLPHRKSLTGDYCLDQAIAKLQNDARREFRIIEKTESWQQRPDGSLRTLTLQTDLCQEPLRFDFLLLRPDACSVESSELLARGRIRMSPPRLLPACLAQRPVKLQD